MELTGLRFEDTFVLYVANQLLLVEYKTSTQGPLKVLAAAAILSYYAFLDSYLFRYSLENVTSYGILVVNVVNTRV